MKKLGLRAVAGGLALLLTASVFAPATPANAADVLLIAPAPKTLVITADMVDDDGEIVISNEKWDRIVIEKEAAAKDIYFDGVEVGELVVESGNSAKVQLWDVDVEQVTVKEPELDNLSLKDLATLLADKETRAETLEMYFAIRAKNENAKKTAPTIVTMEDAKVDKMVARANAALDLATGEVGVVALEASSEVATARVTLKNYKGDVAFTGTEGKSNMILNNVNSTIESLKVEESAANNILTVNSQGSVIEKAEIGGNAKVSLNIPMKSLEVTEEATAANVRVLNKVDEMEVAADSAKVEVTASGIVSDAVVTGDKVNIGGNGSLTNVEITGSDAYVSTEGTKVEGENTYVKPVYVETPKDLEYEIGLLPSGGWNNTKLSSNDGGERYKLNESYGGEVFYTFPNVVDAAKYEEVVIKVKVDSDSPDALRVKLTHVGADKDEYGNPVPFFMSEVPSGSGEVEVVLPLDIHAGKMIDQVRFQSTADGTVATFYSISFKARLDGPAEPIVLPTEGTQCTPNTWEVVVFDSVDFRKYAGTTVKITAEALRCGGSVGPKAQRQFNDSSWTEIEKDFHIEIGTDWTDFGAESFEVPAAWATAAKPIYYGIRTVPGEDYSRCLIFQKGFSVELLEGEIAPEQPDVPVIPEGAYTFDKVVKAKDGWNASFVVNDNKGAVITYTGDYSQAFFKIPDDVDITKLESVTLNGIDVGNYMIRLLTASNLDTYNGNNADIDGDWDNPTVSTKGKTDIKYIVLMSQKAQEIVVDSVSFKMKDATGEGGSGDQGGTEDEDPTPTPGTGEETSLQKKYMVGDKLTEDWGNADCVIADGKATLTFDAVNQEKRFKLPEVIDLSKVESIVYHMESQSAPMNFYIMVDVASNEKINFYYNVDKTDYTHEVSGKTDKIDSIGVQLGLQDVTKEETAVFLGVTFNMKEDVEEVDPTPEVTVTIAELDSTTLTLDDTLTLTATASVSGSAITWSSSKPEVATVDENGVVTPLSAGSVTITAACGAAEASVDLTVVKAFYLKTWDDTAKKFVICSKDVPFEGTTKEAYGAITANTITVYGLEYLSGMLPEALSGTVDLSTFDAISENVDKFVFEATVTKCTGEGAFFQAGVQAGKSYSYAGKFTDYSDAVSIRGVSDTNPVVVIAEVTMDEVISAGVVELSQVTGQIVASEEGIDVAGTCTVKVVLK